MPPIILQQILCKSDEYCDESHAKAFPTLDTLPHTLMVPRTQQLQSHFYFFISHFPTPLRPCPSPAYIRHIAATLERWKTTTESTHPNSFRDLPGITSKEAKLSFCFVHRRSFPSLVDRPCIMKASLSVTRLTRTRKTGIEQPQQIQPPVSIYVPCGNVWFRLRWLVGAVEWNGRMQGKSLWDGRHIPMRLGEDGERMVYSVDAYVKGWVKNDGNEKKESMKERMIVVCNRGLCWQRKRKHSRRLLYHRHLFDFTPNKQIKSPLDNTEQRSSWTDKPSWHFRFFSCDSSHTGTSHTSQLPI